MTQTLLRESFIISVLVKIRSDSCGKRELCMVSFHVHDESQTPAEIYLRAAFAVQECSDCFPLMEDRNRHFCRDHTIRFL